MKRLFFLLHKLFGGVKDQDATDKVESLIKQGQFDEAKTVLGELVSSMPRNWKPFVESAKVSRIAFWDETEFLSYLTCYKSDTEKEIIWTSPSYSKALYYLAFMAVEQKDWINAFHYVEQGLDLEPDHPLLLCEKALILNRLKRHTEAYQIFREAIRTRPWAPPKYFARAIRGAGTALVDMERLNEAEVILRESLRIEPENEGAKNELIYIEQLRNGEAPTEEYYLGNG